MPRLPILALIALAAPVLAQAPTPAQSQLRAIYQELVEINTADSSGSCTAAAEAMGARLKAAGLPASDVQVLVPSGNAKKGNLLARYRGTSGGTGARKPLLLLAHIDVVEAKREDWQRDPFKLVEEDGYFYARGAADDKAMAAQFVANLLRYRQEGYRPERDLILALTCDEEIIPSDFNGVEYLLRNHRALMDAELALNEGGGGALDRQGKPLRFSVLAAEKVFQSYRLEVTNPGGHSAQPRKDNALYQLAGGLVRLAAHDFPARLLPVTRAFFERMSTIVDGQAGADMKAILRDPPDAAALARLSQNPGYNGMLRTTCVATMAEAGHATNALPQRAAAVVNCRVLPGESVDEVRSTLVRVLADEKISVAATHAPVLSPPAPLEPQVMGAVETLVKQMWPGVPIVAYMAAGATDGRFLNNAGIPTYGISGLFSEPETSGAHGLNERLPVRALYEGQEFLYRLVKTLAGGN
jgi:acetylornithine deacetylase/succinyl-diaminopimelate desuccinylase-like protein